MYLLFFLWARRNQEYFSLKILLQWKLFIHYNVYWYERSQIIAIFGSEASLLYSYNHNLHLYYNPLGLCISTCWHKLSPAFTPVHLMGEMGIKYWSFLTRQLTLILGIVFLFFHSNYPSSHDVYWKFKYLVNNPITLVYKYSVIQ